MIINMQMCIFFGLFYLTADCDASDVRQVAPEVQDEAQGVNQEIAQRKAHSDAAD